MPADPPTTPDTVPGLLAAQVAGDAGRPLVTWYDHADGARVELSVVTTANWVAKTAGLLRDVLGAAPGSRVTVDLPAHWQSAVWVLATWTLGAVLVPPGSADVDVAVVGPNVVDADVPDAQEVVATALHPLGARFAATLPVGVTDFGGEVLAMPDAFAPHDPVTADALAYLDAAGPVVHAGLVELAAARATSLGLGEGGRLLSTTDPTTLEGALTTVLAPLVVSGSLVLVSNPDPGRLDEVAVQEQVDVRAV
uniref:TIGR03089 family protein n=1 Tax=uncultured Nocardioidaceae bacterium TaxID=253824 RepID=A0A6J4LME3_9ACTN|nr:MAG: hypothetical protein AVDCRST_MAG46-1762 [uncultured Nocardioidaceae bacterium]